MQARRNDDDCHAPFGCQYRSASGTRDDPTTACCQARAPGRREGNKPPLLPLPTRAHANRCRERGGTGVRGRFTFNLLPLHYPPSNKCDPT
jgi:hypothetical protein